MDSIQFSEFSTNGVNNSDTFDIWRKKTNGIVEEISVVKDSISPLFYNTTENSSALLRTVTLDVPQTITGAKTFSGGTAAFPILKIDTAGVYYEEGALISTVPLKSDRLIVGSQLQLGAHQYSIPVNNPTESSLLGKLGNSLSWTSLSSIIAQVQSEGAANVLTTNVVLPVGTMQPYSSITSVPSGWLSCSGARFKGGDYPELATLLLNTYGPIFTSQTGQTAITPGSEAYNPNWWYTLPDLRGRVTLGSGTGNDGVNSPQTFALGAIGGKYSHALTIAEMPSHNHSYSYISDVTGTLEFGETANDGSILTQNTSDVGGSQAHSIIQPYLVTNYIIKATPDSVVNTFIDRGNVLDIIRGQESLQSLSLTSGGTAALNLRHDNTLRINSERQLGLAPLSIGSNNILPDSIDPSKLSLGGPSWDSGTEVLYEGRDPNSRRRIATREYVDSKIFKTGPAAKLVSRPSSGPDTSAPGFGEFCYINHDGIPIITGENRNNRFGFANKFSHCEMPLPDNRRAVELYVSYDNMCALDNVGELWAIGNISHNLFNIVPFPGGTTVSQWAKAYTPLYGYSPNNKIRKVIMSGDVSILNVAVIDTSNRLWIAGYNQHGVLGRGNSGTTTTSTATKTGGEETPVLENVLDAFLVGSLGSADYATCIALTPSGIHMSGYGGQGQNGSGNNTSINNTFNTINLPNIENYSGCSIYGSGENQYTSIFVKTPDSLLYGWGYNGNNIFGDGSGSNKNIPTVIFNNPDINIDSLYTTTHIGGVGALYFSGQRNNATSQRGTSIESTIAGHLLGTSISSNDSGDIIAVGSPGVGGRVQCSIYNGNSWSTYGFVITTSETNALFGQSVSLNSAGDRLCIGAPDGQLVGSSRFGQMRIYDYSGASWVQRNLSFNGELANSKLGSSVALSGDGNVVVVGAPGYNGNIGRVYIRRITATGTDPVGDNITGTATNQQCGIKVAINTSGTIIAVASNGVSNAGVVRVYSLNNNNWTQLGGDITGRAASDGAINISLDGAGTLLAIGAPGSDVAGSNSGTTRVYNYNSSTTSWVQLGTDIHGLSVNEASGTAVAFSRDGSVLAIGAPNGDAYGQTDSGTVRLLRYDDLRWKLLTGTLAGETASEKFGGAIALSSTGSNVLAAAPSWNSNRGRVRSIGFVSAPIISYEIWCAGKNTGNKFSLTGDTPTWRQMGPLPSGYQIKEFWPGNGYYSNNVNFVKAYRPADDMYYLFAVGSNTKYESGYGTKTVLNTWTRLNLQSHTVDNIIDIQSVSPYGGEDYTILHINDGTLYFAGYNGYMIDPNLPVNNERTDFTRIK
jgi:microcystin-dependent protein